MELKLSALDAISGNLAHKAADGARSAFSAFEVITPETTSKPAEGREIAPELALAYQHEQTERERTLEIYRRYQRNISRSEELRADILRGARTGTAPARLLLQAAKCISLMTTDELFYSQLAGDMAGVYGAGLLEREPLEMELEEVQERLQRLQRSLERDGESEETRRRINTAIAAHRERESHLQELIKREKPRP